MIASASAASDRSADRPRGGFSRTANMRRRASLLRKRLPNKSSPHVGWFRHAPPVPVITGRPRARSLRETKEMLAGATAGTTGLTCASSLQMKSSPYIGWFRHAPPSRLDVKRMYPADLQELLDLTGGSGQNKHSRMSSSHDSNNSLLGDLEMLLKMVAGKNGAVRATHVDGRLPGGHPTHDDAANGSNASSDPSFPPLTWLDQRVSASLSPHVPYMYHHGLERRLSGAVQDSISDDASCSTSTTAFAGNADTPSATLGMLHRLAHWFLFPLAHDAAGFVDYDDDALHSRVSSGILAFIFPFLSSLLRNILLLEDGGSSSSKSCNHRQGCDGESSDDDESCASSEQDNDGSTPSSSATEDNISQRLDVSVSSLAERYYAHEAYKELVGAGDDVNPSITTGDSIGGVDGMPSPPSNQQLDYVITQIDIARMVRNASRHLDVESILGLPTITYRAGKRSSSSGISTDKNESDDAQDAETADDERQDPPREYAPTEEGAKGQVRSQDAAIGWSWMMVPPDPDKQTAARIPSDAEGNIDALSDEDAPKDDIGKHQCNDDKDEHVDSCVICLEHFVDGDRLRVLPCSHLFHVGCIDKWLSGSYSDEECFTSGCPTCKKHPVRCREEEELGAGRVEESTPPTPDGNVPSWAFTRLGDAMASSGSTISH